GDKVMQIRNRYDREWYQTDDKGVVSKGTGVFNGDAGVIHTMDEKERALIVFFEDGRVSRYEFGEIEELTLAYAISVHKSQGCEFPMVVMALPTGQTRFMTRNLFYTAVTRAEKLVVLCGSENTVASMVRNTDTQKRFSALALRLKTGRNLL
ncbi:MAG: ATP-binding domain-containing protein, partial [Clostridia bacterium]|nr:ATP-binding domain-containing protein [Clostridia bacterium]